nr:hypothetical protein [Klebsiella pneumoniae subsp. pneumoniae]
MRSNTSPARCGSIWSSLTTMSEAACRRNWVKTATRPELEDIEASARFFEDEDGLHIHSFFFLKMPTITPATLPGVYHPRRPPVHATRARTTRFPPLPYARA